jgi:hypothetical protein
MTDRSFIIHPAAGRKVSLQNLTLAFQIIGLVSLINKQIIDPPNDPAQQVVGYFPNRPKHLSFPD